MKKIILMILLSVVTNFAQVTEEWVRIFEGNFAATPADMAVDELGNVYITGTTNGSVPFTGNDFTTIKYSSNGLFEWEATYNGTANEHDEARAISVDPLGNVYVTGESDGVINGFSSGKDYLTIKYDSQGNELWVRRYHGNNSFTSYNFDSPIAIETDEFGNVYVTGQSVPDGATSGAGYFCTVKYSTDGNFQWARYNLGQSGAGHSVKVSASGNVYVFGSASGSTGLDFITIKYNSSGVQQWAKRYSGFGLIPAAMEIDAEENVYVTGGDSEFNTIKYNSAGDSIWAAIFTGPQGSSHPTDLAVDGFGNVYVTGRSANAQVTGSEYATVKYNSAGQELWTARYEGLGNEQFANSSEAIDLDAAGNVYVTGQSEAADFSANAYDYATIKYNNAGIEQWVIRYDGGESEWAISIFVDTEEKVYITGESRVNGSQTFGTIKYSQGTTLTMNAQAGSQVLEVVSTNGFSIGDNIVINPGGSTEETNTITGFGSILLQTPLQFDHLSGESVVIIINTAVEEIFEPVPEEYFLHQNYPNPFNPTTKIKFLIVESGNVSLKIYDILGNEIANLVNEELSSGTYEVTFDASGLSSGVYFYQMKAGGFVETKKLILMK